MGLIFGSGAEKERRRQIQRAGGYFGIAGPADLIPRRSNSTFIPPADPDFAMRNSVVWAALRTRADLVSTMPYGSYRMATIDAAKGAQKIDAPPSPLMNGSSWLEFLYSSQVELDRSGNAIGIIQEVDKYGYPTEIELAPSSAVDVMVRNRKVTKYQIYGNDYTPDQVWHEKQYTAPGLLVGMSPIMYSAYTSGLYNSVLQFAAEWFTSGQGPRASLKNTAKKITSKEANTVKESWRATQSLGEPFVHGNDWDYSLIAAQSASTDWIESQRFSLVDLARFYGVPADLLDAAVSGQSITYANISQRNLQFLIMNLGPAIVRRETALSGLMPKPRFIEFDTNNLLRMDPETRAQWIYQQIEARTLTPSQARAMDNRPPLTMDDYKEFELSGLNKTATQWLTGAFGLPVPAGMQTEPGPPPEPMTEPAEPVAEPTAEPIDTKGQ